MAVKTVRAQINGIWTTLTLNASSGKYEATIAAPAITSFNLSGGFYPVVVEATDLAGNVTTKNSSDSILGESLKLRVKEITPPTITITGPSTGSYVTNSATPITFQLRDETNGSGIALSSLKFNIDGTILTNTSPGMVLTAVTGGYNGTYTQSSGLTDGVHSVTINVSDNDSNAATAKSISFTVDTVPPSLTVSNPEADTTYTNQSSLTITGTTADVTSGPITLDITVGSTVHSNVGVNADGSFSKVVTLLGGTNTIKIKATDKAGKFTEVTRTVILDTVAPTISKVVITPNPVNVNQSYKIEIEASDV